MRLLKRLFQRDKGLGEAVGLAMPLFPTEVDADGERAIEWVRDTSSELPSIGPIETTDHVTVATIPGGTLSLAYVPAPVPSGDTEGPVALAWHWPEAASAVLAHKSHAICYAASDALPATSLRLLHSRLVAGVAATSGAAGVYVGSALLVLEASSYIEEVLGASLNSLPLHTWVGFNPVADEGSLSAYTTGLSDFGLLELEVHRSSLEWPDVVGVLGNVAHYELDAGVQVGDGETIGFSETDRRRVTHTQSEFIPDASVALVEM